MIVYIINIQVISVYESISFVLDIIHIKFNKINSQKISKEEDVIHNMIQNNY